MQGSGMVAYPADVGGAVAGGPECGTSLTAADRRADRPAARPAAGTRREHDENTASPAGSWPTGLAPGSGSRGTQYRVVTVTPLNPVTAYRLMYRYPAVVLVTVRFSVVPEPVDFAV